MNVLVIGRFQVLHNGHMELFRRAMELGDLLLLGIGSSQESRTDRNPFNVEERRSMLESALESLGAKYRIYDIPDINNPPRYPSHVQGIIKGMDSNNTIIFSGNPYTYGCFEALGYQVKKCDPGDICASDIRRLILEGKEWSHYVPQTTADAISRFNGVEIIRNILR